MGVFVNRSLLPIFRVLKASAPSECENEVPFSQKSYFIVKNMHNWPNYSPESMRRFSFHWIVHKYRWFYYTWSMRGYNHSIISLYYNIVSYHIIIYQIISCHRTSYHICYIFLVIIYHIISFIIFWITPYCSEIILSSKRWYLILQVINGPLSF